MPSSINPGMPAGPQATTLSVQQNFGFAKAEIEALQTQVAGGIQGPQGAQGVQGSSGPQGSAGTGTQGPQGASGTNGAQGAQGASGTGGAALALMGTQANPPGYPGVHPDGTIWINPQSFALFVREAGFWTQII